MSESAAPGAAGQGTETQSTPAIPWLPNADEATVGYVQNKGWDGPQAVLESYRGAEKFISAPVDRRLVMPSPEAPAEEVGAFYAKLGRPADAAGYKLQTPEGGDPEFAKAAAGWFFKHNVPAKMAEGLVQELNTYAAARKSTADADRVARYEADDQALRQKWGAAFSQNLEQAKAFVRGMGLDAGVIDKISAGMGHAATMEFFQSLGAKMGEADFVSGGKHEPFGAAMTPAQAKDRITTLSRDKEFGAKLRSHNAEAMAEWDRLHRFAYPEPTR